MKKTHRLTFPWLSLLPAGLLVALAGALPDAGAGRPAGRTCGTGTARLGSPQFVSAQITVTPTTLQTRQPMEIRTSLLNVWTGSPGGQDLTMLGGRDWQTLPGGSRITTDRDGEGWLRFLGENRRECGLLYVFQQSGLTVDKCPKSLRAAGNSVCNTGGATAYRNFCRSELILQTPTARVRPTGTWIGLVYVPERELTLVLLFEGRAEVQPVRTAQGDVLGRSSTLGAGSFWLTSPDGTPQGVGGFVRGGTYPLTQLPDLVEVLRPTQPNLFPWVRRIVDHARLDGVPVPTSLVEYVGQTRGRREPVPPEPRQPNRGPVESPIP